MGRLFVPTGEGQHPLVPRTPEPLPAHSVHLSVCCLLSGIWTAGCSIFGRARPGTFLRTSASVTAGFVLWDITKTYSARQLFLPALKNAGIEKPKAWKLWENNGKFTLDDAALGGGVLGLICALRPTAFPGVRGWQRFLGAASVGWAFGGTSAGYYFRASQHFQMALAVTHYQELQEAVTLQVLANDDKFVASLTKVGRWYLKYLTWNTSHMGHQQHSQPQQLAGPFWLLTFEDGASLMGCDHDGRARSYQWNTDNNALDALQDRISELRALRQQYAIELEYVQQVLAKKEYDFFQMTTEDFAKDVLRRELQLLNGLSETLFLQRSLFEFHIQDSEKLYNQIQQKNMGSTQPWVPAPTPDLELPDGWQNRHSPHISTLTIRRHWEQNRQMVSDAEQSESDGLVPIPDGSPSVHGTALEQQKKNVLATERVLKEFEEQIQKSDEQKDY
ncbi:uncharacterized protein BDR25DRAFT_320317 [Lindgomyces ingoldianus]|uniref:Uncharacterized protein n=1 Tax=Lindgomyces ingoldianus TaxID=673940 RepID=A0ACB6Q7Z2_9PLEO|nr:uncharacterized protein BDR25DRAFT_320317 [Lindgomyces ingoldianus]KAF2463008.1 hypothetical protein BDR25DRAFT_320317 [Lindgomyces ingoldianus]